MVQRPRNEVTAYPNPAKEYIQIDLNNFDQANVTMSVVDIAGREVKTTNRLNISSTLDVSSLITGFYTILISDKERRGAVRFIKE